MRVWWLVYGYIEEFVDGSRRENSYFNSCVSVSYDPCSIRGGARRSLVPFPSSLLYPPSPNYSLLGGAFVAGDCGPGAVVVVVTLMCELFPQSFDITKAPKYAIEIRCLLAGLLMNSTLFDSHFQSVDPVLTIPQQGTLFSGILQRDLFQRSLVEESDTVAWKRRLALLVCPGEGTLTPDGRRGVDMRLIVWFTLDVVYLLVRYLLRQAFMGDPLDFDGWCAHQGPARHSHGPICYVPGVAPWHISKDQEMPANPYDPYAICVLHVGTHFQVHVRRTTYVYNGLVALNCPYQDCPGRYGSRYTRSTSEYRRHVVDPEIVARLYMVRYNTAVKEEISPGSVGVSLSLPFLVSSEYSQISASMTFVGSFPRLVALPSDVSGFLFAEPIEAVEQALAARDALCKLNSFGKKLEDFPTRLPSFDIAVEGLLSNGDACGKDANFNLASRPRVRLGPFGDVLTSMVARGDHQSMVPVTGAASEITSILATGPSCCLGEGVGLFIFDDEVHFNSIEPVIDKDTIIGWFDLVPLDGAELSFTPDCSISELVFGDGPRYFYMHETLLSIQCVWCPTELFDNNCSWISEGPRVGIQAEISLVNRQECFLPFGWTYGPTRNKSPFVCYQIWQGHKVTILGTKSSFHHRLAWLLTKDFVDPSPRHLMRTSWGLRADPPAEALASFFSYNRWLESLQSSLSPGSCISVDEERVTGQTSGVIYNGVMNAVPNIPRKKLKPRQRRRIAAAVLKTSVAKVLSDTISSSEPYKRTFGQLQEALPAIRVLEPIIDDMDTKRNKSIRRAWRKWEHRYVTAQQQTWAALQILATAPSELHFANQLREIAVEFSSTPDCSDNSEYIAQQRAEGSLLQFDLARLNEDEKLLFSLGLDDFIESRFVKFPGLGYDDLYQFVSERGLCEVKRDRLFELLEFGQSAFMLDTFVPNDCSKAVKNGVGYDSHRVLCEHTAAKLYSESRCILVREELLVSRHLTRGLHVSPCNTVHKEGAVKRVVTDLSHGRDKISSYNHSVDLEKHLDAYPRNALPTLRHVATLACQMRREHEGAGLLHGGVVDVRTAYQQYRLSLSKAKLVCTRLLSRRQINGFDQDIAVIMIALTGTFGDVGAGDTYAILGDVFHELHNAVWALWRSVTYVDDMLILAPPFPAKPHPYQLHRPFHACEGVFGGRADGAPPVLEGTRFVIHQAVTYARNLVGNVLGAQATEPRKSKWFYGCLIGIGWYFNLIYSEFYVLPKPEKLRKIVHYLFNVVPVGSEIAPYTAVRELQGLLCWFSAALPLGKSFVYSLFRCRPNKDGIVTFSAVTMRDLDFWRSLARCAMLHPNLFGTKLENLEFGRKPSYYVRTDACTGHGGGGWVSKSKTWEPGTDDARCFALRWTDDELRNINKWMSDIPRPSTNDDLALLQDNLPRYCSDETVPTSVRVLDPLTSSIFPEQNVDGTSSGPSVDINVLEFVTAVFAIMLWAPKMQGSCVCFGADNTATLCWLVKHKTTNLASDVILKLLALTCAVFNIQLVTEFIPGVQNVLADWLSRVSGGESWDVAVEASELCGGTQGFFRENLHMMAKDHARFSRRLISRTILMRTLTVVEPIAFSTLLAMILALKGDDDSSCDINDAELKGTLNGIAYALRSTLDGVLQVPMRYNDAVEEFYFRPACNVPKQKIISTNPADSVPSSFGSNFSRVLLPRRAKTMAIDAISKTILEPPKHAYRIPEIKDMPGVKVSIANSTHRGANLGLYLTRGPAPNGSAPKGTRLATYDGRCFVTTADIASIEKLEYQSDYLWGKLNPLTRIYTIVDAADPKSCYTRYVNEGFFESNCEVVLGSDDVLYLVATTDIAPNEELTMPYGAPFWTLPERWMSLPLFLQEAVLQFYDCVPPNVSNDTIEKTLVREEDVELLTGFGPAYSSDNAGDGPSENALHSGWGSRQHTSRSFGKGWDSILSSDMKLSIETRDRLKASFPSLQAQAMASCHAPSTLRSYGSGWRSWYRFCEFFEKSPTCEDLSLIPMPFHDIIAQIQNYIHFECAVRQIQPDSIKNVYLAGIADYFDRYGVFNRFREASNHNCVQLVLTSYSRSWKKKHPDSSKVKIAFGLSYAVHAEQLIQSGVLTVGGYVCSDRKNLMLYMIGVRVVTALWLGIFFLLRKNEFLPHAEDPNGMQEPCRRRNLRFFDEHKLEIPYVRDWSSASGFGVLHLRFSKTDQTGHGRIVQHESTDDPVTCVVRRLEEYIRVSRDYFHATVGFHVVFGSRFAYGFVVGSFNSSNEGYYNRIRPSCKVNFGTFLTIRWSNCFIPSRFPRVYYCILWWMGRWFGCDATIYRSICSDTTNGV